MIPKLRDSMQLYATKFANNWDEFARMAIKVSSDYLQSEIELSELERSQYKEGVSEDKDTNSIEKIQDFFQKPYVYQILLNEFDMLLG